MLNKVQVSNRFQVVACKMLQAYEHNGLSIVLLFVSKHNIFPPARVTEIEFLSSPPHLFKPSLWAVWNQKATDIASAHVFGALHCCWRKRRRAKPALVVDSDKEQDRPPVAQREAGLMPSHARMHQQYARSEGPDGPLLLPEMPRSGLWSPSFGGLYLLNKSELGLKMSAENTPVKL